MLKKTINLSILFVSLGVLFYPISSQADVATWISVDARSGKVLEQHKATDRWYPASLTKMMTAYVTFEAIKSGRLKLSDPVIVSAHALAQPPSKMGFKVGTVMTLDNALTMVIVKSANDIAVAVSEAVSGSEADFVAEMNRAAQRLGMGNTHFVNPNGLPAKQQVTTARDMAILARKLWLDFPQYKHYWKNSGIKFGGKTLPSGNKEFLLRVAGANGMKTGYICDSGFNVATTVSHGGRDIISVVLGASSVLERGAFAKKLTEVSLGRYDGPSLYSLDGKGKEPPKKGYCKRGKKPKAQELVDRFGKSHLSDDMLAYATTAGAFPEGEKVSRKSKSGKTKVNWPAVYENILGLRVKDYNPVPVRVGLSNGVKNKMELLARSGNALVPRPKPKQGSLLPVNSAKGGLELVRKDKRTDPFGVEEANQRKGASQEAGSLYSTNKKQKEKGDLTPLFSGKGGLYAPTNN
ncbi:D-alanyl-D-alanine carboxypeptidase family protein [Polycladidibacter stylochi]|uniref:D-alanyl-D-alanine carboxypeptidase family protein n=1 Tax=Polycladidibacter stylochi TaxID=1807766 RepID=UPI000833699B|nr:D-alanyl-D-alanine carboxypeptidase family protein [Pseudovibrio stylochi]